MKKILRLLFVGFVLVQLSGGVALAQQEQASVPTVIVGQDYFKNLGRNWKRGLENIVTFPIEIPVTIKKYQEEDSGLSGVRHLAGLTDGIVRGVARASSGVWDLLVSVIPGSQDGVPVNPQTLF